MVVVPDARKTLQVLKNEWEGCQRCSLGVHRENVGGQMVFGEGRTRGILFVGEGPGITEEREGRPFVGRSGFYLRGVMEKFKITNYYITNLVLCRSCVPATDADGNQLFTRGWPGRPPEPKFRDQPPNKDQVAACAARFYEELYLVDPLIIVALGGPAASFLRGGAVKITRDRGEPEEIQVPGAGAVPSLTTKKKEWARKVGDTYVFPTEQNNVTYLMIPTLHPAFVARQVHDMGAGNPFEKFAEDLRLAKRIYDRMNYEMYGLLPEVYDEQIPYELLDEHGEYDDEQG